MASRVDSNVNCIKSCFINVCTSPKALGFAVAIIVGIGGLGVAGVGFASFGAHKGWWAAGALSNLSQIDAIIMMAAGGAGGIVLLIIGIVGTVKNGTWQQKFTADMIESLEVGVYKETCEAPYTRYYLSWFTFTNGEKREVYLLDEEVGAFKAKLGNKKFINNSPVQSFSMTQQRIPVEVFLDELDGEIAERAKKLA
jgi:hypothetical protein